MEITITGKSYNIELFYIFPTYITCKWFGLFIARDDRKVNKTQGRYFQSFKLSDRAWDVYLLGWAITAEFKRL